MTNVYDYLANYYLMTEADYKYVGYKTTCKYNAAKGKLLVPTYTSLSSGSVSEHMNAI